MCESDEHPRETSLEKLSNLKPVFKQDGTVTAGNASVKGLYLYMLICVWRLEMPR